VTDAWLMEADCVHGLTWFDCDTCAQPRDTTTPGAGTGSPTGNPTHTHKENQ
jgi:hypothetical protein